MNNIIHTTFWNYNKFSDYKPSMLRDWIELGITTPILPTFDMEQDSHEKLREILDDAENLGVSVILQVNSVYIDNYNKGEEIYRADVQAVESEFGSHPAVYGYYVGEEPSDVTHTYYMEGVRVIKEVAPDKAVYMNFGSIERTNRVMLKGKGSIDEWVAEYNKYTGSDLIGYGCYSGLFRDYTGAYEHFENIRAFVEAGKKCGVGVWATMLSSAHDFYRVANEDDFRWQINTCMACGCKGVVWFRLYDKLVAGDYRSSPIDEFGVKTQRFYDLARVQKKFNIHYGKILAELDHLATYGLGVSYGGYSYFTPEVSEEMGIVDSADCRSGMLSYFKDKDGGDYLIIINNHWTESYHLTLTFTDEVKKAQLVYYNGEMLSDYFDRKNPVGAEKGPSMCLAPGQMELIKITKA